MKRKPHPPERPELPDDLVATRFLEAGKEAYRTGYLAGWKAGWEAGLRQYVKPGKSGRSNVSTKKKASRRPATKRAPS